MDGEIQDKTHRCRFCDKLTPFPCEHCLRSTIVEASKTYKEISADKELVSAIPRLDKDPRLDLAMVMGNSLLKLSGLEAQTSNALPFSLSLRDLDLGLLLQAILVLDTQLKATPSDTGLRLLLVKLYLLLGCPSYAQHIWIPMDVKRTIQDALSPLFFDRISSLAPNLFTGIKPLMEPLRSHYNYTLGNKCPLRIWDAFSSGSYSSILEMSDYDDKLRRSCTLMMTLVEERRATRMFGGKIEAEIDDLALTGGLSKTAGPGNMVANICSVADIVDSTTFVNKTDYGSFTNLESKHGAPIQEFVKLGPELSVSY